MFSVLTNGRIPAARLYALLYLCFGLTGIVLLLFVVPPFQVPDEINHFKRADQVSRGGLVGHRIGTSAGGAVSAGIDASAHEFAGIPFHAEAKVTHDSGRNHRQVPP